MTRVGIKPVKSAMIAAYKPIVGLLVVFHSPIPNIAKKRQSRSSLEIPPIPDLIDSTNVAEVDIKIVAEKIKATNDCWAKSAEVERIAITNKTNRVVR